MRDYILYKVNTVHTANICARQQVCNIRLTSWLLVTPCDYDNMKLDEALRERRLPWPRQIITPLLHKMKNMHY